MHSLRITSHYSVLIITPPHHIITALQHPSSLHPFIALSLTTHRSTPSPYHPSLQHPSPPHPLTTPHSPLHILATQYIPYLPTVIPVILRHEYTYSPPTSTMETSTCRYIPGYDMCLLHCHNPLSSPEWNTISPYPPNTALLEIGLQSINCSGHVS